MTGAKFSKHLIEGQSVYAVNIPRPEPADFPWWSRGRNCMRHWCVVGCLVWRALLLALAVGATGCSSIYHRTRSELPPDPAVELELRLADARRAEEQAAQAGRKLGAHLRQGRADAVIAADFDRLEVAGFELERRTLAARDANSRIGEPAEAALEIERLLNRAAAWIGFVRQHRAAPQESRMAALEKLLANP